MFMKIYVKVNGEVIGKGKDMKSVLKHVSKLCREGKDVNISGGRLGSWQR